MPETHGAFDDPAGRRLPISKGPCNATTRVTRSIRRARSISRGRSSPRGRRAHRGAAAGDGGGRRARCSRELATAAGAGVRQAARAIAREDAGRVRALSLAVAEAWAMARTRRAPARPSVSWLAPTAWASPSRRWMPIRPRPSGSCASWYVTPRGCRAARGSAPRTSRPRCLSVTPRWRICWSRSPARAIARPQAPSSRTTTGAPRSSTSTRWWPAWPTWWTKGRPRRRAPWLSICSRCSTAGRPACSRSGARCGSRASPCARTRCTRWRRPRRAPSPPTTSCSSSAISWRTRRRTCSRAARTRACRSSWRKTSG